jgi:hypothetical protein
MTMAQVSQLLEFAGANAVYDYRFGQRGSTQNGFEIARLNAAKTDSEPVSKPGGSPVKSVTMVIWGSPGQMASAPSYRCCDGNGRSERRAERSAPVP